MPPAYAPVNEANMAPAELFKGYKDYISAKSKALYVAMRRKN